MFRKCALDQAVQIRLEVDRLLQFIGKLLQFLGHNGIQGNVGAGNRLGRSRHTELKFIAGKGNGRGSVAICIIQGDRGHGIHTDLKGALANLFIFCAVDNRGYQIPQFITQENGDNSRGSFLRAQTVIIAREGNRCPQEILIVIHTLDKGGKEQQEPGILAGSRTGFEQVSSGIGAQGPVVVLAGTVDTGKGLSWSRQTKSCRSATFFIISMVSWLWSHAVLASE